MKLSKISGWMTQSWRLPKISTTVMGMVCGIFLHPLTAIAEPLPANKLVTSVAVSPASAWARFGASTVHTAGIAFSSAVPPDAVALAKGLGSQRSDVSTAQYTKNVADYIRNNIDTEFRFGLGKGAKGVLIDQSGTPFDQAELMIILLQQKGISATYKVGIITLDAQQFGNWTGFVTGLDQASQTFAVNARAACQLLADGGIPAIVNGSSDCATVSGNLSSVTMGHVWVEAGGVWYDPSFKRNILISGLDIATAAGCGNYTSATCGSQVTSAAMSGTSTGTISGYPWIRNVNKAGLGSQLNTYAVNIENYIRANAQQGDIFDVVGGRRRDTTYSPPLAGTSLPYPSVVQYSWSGAIPDQFRTMLRLQFLDIDISFFMDELSGRKLYYTKSRSPWGLWLDEQNIATTACTESTPGCGVFATSKIIYDNNGGSNTINSKSAYITATFNHPYASSTAAPNQATVQFVREAITGPSFVVAASVGTASRSTELYFSNLVASRRLGSAPPLTAGDQAQVELARFAAIRADQDMAAQLAAAVGNAGIARHHTLAVFESHMSAGPTGSLTSVLSVQAADGDSQKRLPAFEMVNVLDTVLEARDPNYFAYSGAHGTFAFDNAQSIQFINVPASGFSAVSASLADYTAFDKSVLQAGSVEGYNLIIPQDGRASCSAFLTNPDFPSYSGVACPSSETVPAVAYNGLGSGFLIAGRWKAVGEPSPTLPDLSAKNFSAKDKKYLGLDPALASMKLSPPPDIVTGIGPFPMSLSFARTYDSTSNWNERWGLNAGYLRYTQYNGPDPISLPEKLGGGWTHNFMSYASVSSSQSSMLGEVSGIDASAVLGGLISLRGIYSSGTFQNRLSGIFTADWMASKIANSTMLIRALGKEESFVRLPSGAFNGPRGSTSALAISGSYDGPYAGPQPGPTYGYLNMNVTYTDSDGGQYLFSSGKQGPNVFARINSMVSPTGVRASFVNNYSGTQSGTTSIDPYLLTATNSLGHSLTLATSGSTPGVAYNPRLLSVTDETGRSASFLRENCPIQPTIYPDWPYVTLYVCDTFKVTLPDNSQIKYEYNPGTDSPDPTIIVRPQYKLRRVYTAGNLTTPFRTFRYDDVFRVAEVNDALGHSTKLYPGSLNREALRVTAQIDGLGAETVSRFNDSGALLQATDPLGRTSAKVYDKANRLIREIMPEGNAVEYSYDVRGNRLTECTIAKGRVNWAGLTPLNERQPQCSAGAGDLVTATVYMEGPTVRPDQCSNAKTCNKPSYVVDARGNRTDYTWSATHGQLLTETMPADTNGIRPVTTYGYTAYNGSDGAVFYLLTSRQAKMDASNTSTTTYSYDASNHWVLKSMVQAGGGTALTTCFKFDGVGNLISKTEPKAGIGTCP